LKARREGKTWRGIRVLLPDERRAAESVSKSEPREPTVRTKSRAMKGVGSA
jgi:hypothetical protein